MRRVILSLVAVAMWSPSIFAQENPWQSASSISSLSWNSRDHSGWSPFVSANLGYSNNVNDLNAEGVPSSFKLLGSYQTQNTLGVFDLGYGLLNQSFTQAVAMENNISAPTMELAARYQFSNHLQLGTAYNQYFSKGVNFGANQADAEFAGIQLLKEFGMGDLYTARFGGKVLTSLNVNNQTSNMFLLEFQLGWGGSRPVSTIAN